MSKRTSSHLSANGLFEEMVKQDVQYWKKRCQVPCKNCYLIRRGRRIDEIHEHYRKIGSEYCTSIFSSQKADIVPTRDERCEKEDAHQELDKLSMAIDLHNQNGAIMSLAERDLYVDVLRCCKEPSLARSERICKPKDKFRDDSERLSSYAGDIFNLPRRCHEQYQHLIQTETQKESLLRQLYLLEINSNPFYNEDNFENFLEYKRWQDSERESIWQHLDNTTSPPSREGQPRVAKNRREQYRRLAEKVILNDLGLVQKKGNTSSTSMDAKDPNVLSKCGRRLMTEFAERFRVSAMSRLCCHLEVLADCLERKMQRLDSILYVAIEIEINDIMDLLSQESLCVSERVSLFKIAGKLTEMVKNLVVNLLTEWIPTPKLLKITLELAKTSFQLLEVIGEDGVEWPECLSEWLHCAIKKKYHSYKESNDKETQELFFASVEYAVDVLKLLKRGGHDNLSYEGVLNEYIPDFVQVFTHGIYVSVEADEATLAKTLTTSISIQTNPDDMGSDALNLWDMALSYKLAEFDNIASDSTGDSEPRPHVSWRIAYHPVAMHWLDILSCHMRRQVNAVVNVEYQWSNDTTVDEHMRKQGESQRNNSCESSNNDSAIQPQGYQECGSSDDDLHQNRLHSNQFDNTDASANESLSRCVHTRREHSRSSRFPSTLQSTVNASRLATVETSSPMSSLSSISENSSSDYDVHCSSNVRHADCLPRLVVVDENFNGVSSCSVETLIAHETYGDSKTVITTSLADFTSIMTRFIQVVNDVIATIYILPLGVKGENHDVTEGQTSLKDHKNHFILKAIEALCSSARQYITSILRKQLGHSMANIIVRSRTTDDIAIDAKRRLGEFDQMEKINIHQIFRHFNNLLVLHSGLPHAIHMLERLLVPAHDQFSQCSDSSDADVFMTEPVTSTDSSDSADRQKQNDRSSRDLQEHLGGLSVLSRYLKDQISQLLQSSIKGLGDILIHCKMKKFRATFSHVLHCLPMSKLQLKVTTEELAVILRELLSAVTQDCYKEGYSLLYRQIWIAIMHHFQFNTQLLICNGRLRYRKQCKYHLQVFGCVANTYYQYVREDNCSSVEILDLDRIKPTLEMLEVLSMPTKALITMRDDENADIELFAEFCMAELEEKKSFTGAELMQAVLEVNLRIERPSVNDELEICQHFLSGEIIRFLFRKKRVDRLPNIISEDIACTSSMGRSDSVNTYSSQESSNSAVDTDSGDSNSSDFERTFFCDDKTIYRFTDRNRMLPRVCLKDHPVESGIECHRLHVMDVLRYRSSCDIQARNFLRQSNPTTCAWLPCIS